jgi:hypothetical protein
MFSFLLDGSDGGALSQWSIALAGGFLGSIVGAIIGGKYAVGAVKTADTLTRSNEAKNRAQELRARRVALNAELKHILETVAKISEKVKAYELSPMLLSSDFLAACRLDWYKADPDTEFVKALAQAYQEVVFANDSVNYIVNLTREMCKGGGVPIEFQKSLSQTLKVPVAEVQRTAGRLKELNADKLASMAK